MPNCLAICCASRIMTRVTPATDYTHVPPAAQRALPPLQHRLVVDEAVKGPSVYAFWPQR